MDKLKNFFQKIEAEREFTGDVKQVVLNGEAEVRVSVHEDENEGHRNGSFTLLFNVDGEPEELLSTKELYRAKDINPEIESIEEKLMSLIDENCGYNPYEPIFDLPSARFDEDEYDIVAHDSFVVFD